MKKESNWFIGKRFIFTLLAIFVVSYLWEVTEELRHHQTEQAYAEGSVIPVIDFSFKGNKLTLETGRKENPTVVMSSVELNPLVIDYYTDGTLTNVGSLKAKTKSRLEFKQDSRLMEKFREELKNKATDVGGCVGGVGTPCRVYVF